MKSEKGTWIFHLLRQRMGDAAFHDFQVKVIKDFTNRPISNEALREAAVHFIPETQRDHQLTAFFDTWVYDTGVPTLAIKGGNLLVSGVQSTYTVDVPLVCGGSSVMWLRATEGETQLPRRSCALPPRSAFLFRD
jgi:aminopeptidase N